MLHSVLLTISLGLYAAETETILLRLKPVDGAPILSEVIATEKALFDAKPVEGYPEWQQLTLPLQSQGYIPTEALSKNFEMVTLTPVHAEPSEESALITKLRPDDVFEFGEFEGEWTEIRFGKILTGYFKRALETETTPSVLGESSAAEGDLSIAALSDPNRGSDAFALEALPSRKVNWKAGNRSSAEYRGPGVQYKVREPGAPALPEGMVATSTQTEKTTFGPGQTREDDRAEHLLSGVLVREINEQGPVYPIRLRSPEGRLIAYVDLSEIFVPDFSPFLKEKVYVRGPVYQLEGTSSQLVIVAQSIKLTE